MMRQTLLFAFALILLAPSTSLTAAQTRKATIASTNQKDIAAIRAVLDKQVAAWNQGDIDGYMAGYDKSPQTIFISGDSVTRGWQTVRDRYKKRYDSREKMGTLEFKEVETTMQDRNTAVVIGAWGLKRANDNPHGRFTLIMKRLPEGWRIVHDHTSSAS
jgi:ketosteroid isomerase-like protein